MHVMFDISRLLTRGLHRTPTGIDRVDMAYATCLVQGHRKVSFCFGRLPTLRITTRTALPATGANLTESEATEPQYDALCALLAEPEGLSRSTGATRLQPPQARLQPAFDALARAWRPRPRAKPLPQNLNGITYLHTSHFGLEQPGALKALKGRGARIVTLLHDLIPVDYPEYCRPGEAEKHESRLSAVQASADLVLVNSTYTRNRLKNWADGKQLAMPPVRVVPLGVSARYQSRQGLRPPVSARPYFVMVGTIEARKNHAFLLALWRRLAEETGNQCPLLVLAGNRGWEMEAARDLLERCPELGRNVIEINGLGDFSLASLMTGASAVLLPSLVEGFSLPVAEAQSLGIRVIASDIAAHREIAAPSTVLIDPLDGPAWLAHVRDCLGSGASSALQGWPASGEAAHVQAALEAIDSLL